MLRILYARLKRAFPEADLVLEPTILRVPNLFALAQLDLGYFLTNYKTNKRTSIKEQDRFTIYSLLQDILKDFNDNAR